MSFQSCGKHVCLILKRAALVTDDLIIYVFQPSSSRPYSDQLIGLVPHTQPSLPIPMDLGIAIDIHSAHILIPIPIPKPMELCIATDIHSAQIPISIPIPKPS